VREFDSLGQELEYDWLLTNSPDATSFQEELDLVNQDYIIERILRGSSLAPQLYTERVPSFDQVTTLCANSRNSVFFGTRLLETIGDIDIEWVNVLFFPFVSRDESLF
jgi:hypothetical protein